MRPVAVCHVFSRPEAVPSVGVAGAVRSSTVWARPQAVDAHVLGVGCSPLGNERTKPMGGGPAVHSTHLRAPDLPGLAALPLPFAERFGLGGWGRALGVKATGPVGLGITSVRFGESAGSRISSR